MNGWNPKVISRCASDEFLPFSIFGEFLNEPSEIWVVATQILFYFHPDPWQNDPI